MKLIERIFERNPYNRNGKLTSTIGYMYGQCARMLYYARQSNKIAFTEKDIENMNNGLNKHIEIEDSKFPEMLHEYHGETSIPEIYGINKIGATVDCISLDTDSKIIEIKPRYTRSSYYQTLIERFVFPDIPIFMYDYLKERLFPLKANYKMSIIYLGRMITALNVKPPRFPFAQYSKAPCNKCMFREQCYTENPELDLFADKSKDNKAQWETWKQYTNKPIQTLLNTFYK